MDFYRLYEQYKNLVFNLALQYVHNVEEAEEITQDVFVSSYGKLHQFRSEASLKTWIYRITINHSLDFIKKKRAQKRQFTNSSSRLDPEEAGLKITDFHHPGVALEQQEEVAYLFSQINRLRANQKTVLVLLKIKDLPVDEVATILRLSPKAVESLLQRAKKNLQKFLNENE